MLPSRSRHSDAEYVSGLIEGNLHDCQHLDLLHGRGGAG